MYPTFFFNACWWLDHRCTIIVCIFTCTFEHFCSICTNTRTKYASDFLLDTLENWVEVFFLAGPFSPHRVSVPLSLGHTKFTMMKLHKSISCLVQQIWNQNQTRTRPFLLHVCHDNGVWWGRVGWGECNKVWKLHLFWISRLTFSATKLGKSDSCFNNFAKIDCLLVRNSLPSIFL